MGEMSKEDFSNLVDMIKQYRELQLESTMKFQQALLEQQKQAFEFCKEIGQYTQRVTSPSHGD